MRGGSQRYGLSEKEGESRCDRGPFRILKLSLGVETTWISDVVAPVAK